MTGFDFYRQITEETETATEIRWIPEARVSRLPDFKTNERIGLSALGPGFVPSRVLDSVSLSKYLGKELLFPSPSVSNHWGIDKSPLIGGIELIGHLEIIRIPNHRTNEALSANQNLIHFGVRFLINLNGSDPPFEKTFRTTEPATSSQEPDEFPSSRVGASRPERTNKSMIPSRLR